MRGLLFPPGAYGVLRKLLDSTGWGVLAFALAVSLLPAVAKASPTFLSAVNVSDAGQDAFEPQVAVDSSGNSLMVWTRSDGTNLRIQARFRAADGTSGPTTTISQAAADSFEPQVAFDPSGNAIAVWTQFEGGTGRTRAAFRPAGGSFGGDVGISSAGTNAPQISIDSTGKAVAVWYRFDGTTDRIQAAVRPAGGSFGGAQTLSAPGVEAFEPMIAAGPNADANAAAVWTGSDGTNLRVQSARRTDVVGYPRPKGASPTRVSLVPSFNSCSAGSANRSHGAPLSHPSCAPPSQSSSVLTVGSPDANLAPTNFSGFARFTVVAGNIATEADEADVRLSFSMIDVRNRPALTDYAGNLTAQTALTITDQSNSAEVPAPGTTQVITYSFPGTCVTTTSTTIGSTCTANTTADALVPGTVVENRRAVWQLGQIQIWDAGPNTITGDGDDTVFARQGVFVP
jgi:hypothetical protein